MKNYAKIPDWNTLVDPDMAEALITYVESYQNESEDFSSFDSKHGVGDGITIQLDEDEEKMLNDIQGQMTIRKIISNNFIKYCHYDLGVMFDKIISFCGTVDDAQTAYIKFAVSKIKHNVSIDQRIECLNHYADLGPYHGDLDYVCLAERDWNRYLSREYNRLVSDICELVNAKARKSEDIPTLDDLSQAIYYQKKAIELSPNETDFVDHLIGIYQLCNYVTGIKETTEQKIHLIEKKGDSASYQECRDLYKYYLNIHNNDNAEKTLKKWKRIAVKKDKVEYPNTLETKKILEAHTQEWINARYHFYEHEVDWEIWQFNTFVKKGIYVFGGSNAALHYYPPVNFSQPGNEKYFEITWKYYDALEEMKKALTEIWHFDGKTEFQVDSDKACELVYTLLPKLKAYYDDIISVMDRESKPQNSIFYPQINEFTYNFIMDAMFKNRCIRFENEENYSEAIRICNIAISIGYSLENMLRRKNRLIKKYQKVTGNNVIINHDDEDASSDFGKNLRNKLPEHIRVASNVYLQQRLLKITKEHIKLRIVHTNKVEIPEDWVENSAEAVLVDTENNIYGFILQGLNKSGHSYGETVKCVVTRTPLGNVCLWLPYKQKKKPDVKIKSDFTFDIYNEKNILLEIAEKTVNIGSCKVGTIPPAKNSKAKPMICLENETGQKICRVSAQSCYSYGLLEPWIGKTANNVTITKGQNVDKLVDGTNRIQHYYHYEVHF